MRDPQATELVPMPAGWRHNIESAIASLRYGSHPYRSPHADDLQRMLERIDLTKMQAEVERRTRGVAAAAPAELAATFRRAWEGPRGGPTDQQIKDRCAAAAIRWIEPDGEPEGFPGSFDMVTMAEMRALLTADGSGVSVLAHEVSPPADADAPIPAEVGRRALEALTNLLAVHEGQDGTKYHAGNIARAAITELQQALEKHHG